MEIETDPKHNSLFPVSNEQQNNTYGLRNPEKFKVNFARTEAYKNSFLPYAQAKLNQYYSTKKT